MSAISVANVQFNASASARIDYSTGADMIYFVGNLNLARANLSSQTLTDGATINWDTSLGTVAYLTLTGTGRTMANPTNLRVGTYILHVIQDGTGGRTITSWGSVFKWPAGVAPVFTTPANRRDIVSFVCDGTNMYGSFLPDVR